MSFQLKIFIIFAISVVLIFSVINFITMNFFTQQQKYEKEILSQLPYYIKAYEEESYINERFKKYSKTILIWEVLFILVLSYLFYKILNIVSKKEKEQEEFLRFLFFVLSHKIGNFLSTLNTNLEILRLKQESRVIDRLQTSCNILSEEITKTIETVKKLPAFRKNLKEINLKEILMKTIPNFETRKKIILSLKDSFINANEETVETILFLIIDNAFKYSKSKIHIKIFKKCLALRNDFAELGKGSGVGLQIVDYLAKKSGYTVKYRAKGEHFLLTLKF